MFVDIDNDAISIHFETDNDQHFIDAFVEASCSTAFLEFARHLAKIYNCEIKVETAVLREGSVIKDFKILWKENSVSKTFYASLLTLLFYNPCNHLLEKGIDRLFEDTELTELQKEALRLEIEQRKSELESCYSLVKKQSDFYKSASKDESIEGISLSVSSNNSHSGFRTPTIKRSSFDEYILDSNKLDPEINDAAIVIIDSPVISDKNYKWRGTYNGVPISFNIQDSEFLVKVRAGIYVFKAGMAIKCQLKCNRSINENGDIIASDYLVQEVYELISGVAIEITSAGKRKEQKKVQDISPNLFTYLDDKQ